jgi:hypothetical protein
MARGKKPDDNKWIDLARGLDAGTAHSKDELDPDTRSRVKRFERFHEFAQAESANRPPEPLLRRAQELASRLPAAKPGRIRTILAALTFDSAAQPALAGIRSIEMGVRQMVYEAGGFDIHLRSEPAAVQGALVLVGQVLDPTQSEPPLRQLPVRLLLGKSEVAATVTNDLGEFQLEHPDLSGTVLEVLLEARGLSLQVPLAGLLEGRP